MGCLLLVCGCGKTEPSSDGGENTGGFVGVWAEKTSERVVLKIAEASEAGKYDIDITWREELPQKDLYKMTAGEDENGKLVYSDCKYCVRHYDNGNFSDTFEYHDGTGYFSLTSGGELIWHDEKKNEDTTFISAEQYADVFEDMSNLVIIPE